jgi:hypothetical protein
MADPTLKLRYITPATSRLAAGSAIAIICEGAGLVPLTVTVSGTGTAAATVVTQTDTRIDITLPARAAGVYSITATGDAVVGTDTLTNCITYMASGTPILTLAETAMESLIGAMSIAGGYNFDWENDVDQEDKAQHAAYPFAVVRGMPDESNTDAPNGAHGEAYQNTAHVAIDVYTRLASERTDPQRDMRTDMYKALDDLKRVFALNLGLGGVVDYIQYKSARITNEIQGDRFVPGKLETEWEITYVQDRNNPSQAA